jgi:hypothetical protein
MRCVADRDYAKTRRRAIRRAVALECEVMSDQWDGAVSLPVTDLSCFGLWVQTLLTLEAGEEVMVSLMPPFWPNKSPLLALATVSRVGMFRRRCDLHTSGMGLEFTDIDTNESHLLANALRGLPPPLRLNPIMEKRDREPLIERGQYDIPAFMTDDGVAVCFRAEHGLLANETKKRRPQLRLFRSRLAAASARTRPLISVERFAA